MRVRQSYNRRGKIRATGGIDSAQRSADDGVTTAARVVIF